MYTRLLNFLCCPHCQGDLEVFALKRDARSEEEITEGLLRCTASSHWFPIVRGVPRMLPDALAEHWETLRPLLPTPLPAELQPVVETARSFAGGVNYDRQTRENFSHEWDNHDLGGTTWGMKLSDRVEWFFLNPLRLPAEELKGKLMLDAGCGNGSQSVAYTAHGLEVIAVDLSSGLEHGQAFRHRHEGARPEKVHFVQANLQRPPIKAATLDIIHSAGVLHHTPDTLQTFRALLPLLKAHGTFYVWLYKYEKLVTPVVDTMRAVTTRIPPRQFARVADVMAVPFIGFCKAVNALGVRKYPLMSRREAALALMDIFGAPYAYYHTYDEVAGWYAAAGFTEVWPCNDDRRGFGVCGRLPANRGALTNAKSASQGEGAASGSQATLQAAASRQGGQF
ncbi:MAG TPA: methyltransferase domain-containing protein [Pyrinomonadaceae bacterium]|nr:methyltransferase domain-containing protein [Pyrinomonadaceae bacterium]